jgi:predicted nuclease of predicted toxin-antitoxin system
VNLFVDECVDGRVVAGLRALGHDIVLAVTIRPGEADSELLAFGLATGRTILTEDKGFGELVIRRGLESPTVVLLRLDGVPIDVRIRVVSDALLELERRGVPTFAVVDPHSLRLRPILRFV